MGIEIYWVFVRGSKLTWFCVRAENDLFSVWGSIDLVFVYMVETDLFFVCGPKMAWLLWGIDNNLIFVWVIDIHLVSVREIEIDLIAVWVSELT